MSMSSAALDGLIARTKQYFNIRPSSKKQVGVLFLSGRKPIPLHSGHSGGPWGGTQRGHVPRGPGSAYSSGAPTVVNIGTHVEGHAIAKMWETGAKRGRLVVSKPPCGTCRSTISIALPQGAQLSVFYPVAGKWTLRHFHSRA